MLFRTDRRTAAEPPAPGARRMSIGQFIIELKRRNVYRAAVAYGMTAWLLAQIATQIFPFFGISNFAVRFVISRS
jgi:hypothetical protein